jgi:hypothetical protein
MKIILEPHEPNREFALPRVELSMPSDDIEFCEFYELMRGVALAWGYASATVDEYMPPVYAFDRVYTTAPQIPADFPTIWR